MPARQNDFGITLAKWGVEQGPYVVLPLFGPQTLRDIPDFATSALTDPTTWIDPPLAASISLGVLRIVDGRSRYDKALRFRDTAAIDPYIFTRDAYLQYRYNQIHEGTATQPAPNQSIYDEDNEISPTTQPAPQSTTQPASRPTTGP